MKTVCLCFLVTGLIQTVAAAPSVTVKSISQDAVSRTVTVVYSLGEPAVVTLGVETNSVALPPSTVRRVWGDVNRLVAADGDHRICWAPECDWPDGFVTNGSFKAVVKAWAKDNPPDWRVTDVILVGGVGLPNHRYYEDASQVPFGVTNDRYKATHLLMRRVRATGVTWRMGRGLTDRRSDYAQEVPHYVTLTNDYYLGVYEVTMRQYYYLTQADNTLPANDPDAPFRPRTGISYDTVISKLPTIRTRTGITGMTLPTEAEWEFACRAGCDAELYNGGRLTSTDGNVTVKQNDLEDIAWYGYNTQNDSRVHKVGLKQPNAWGFYDMLGNAWEITLDRYNASRYTEDQYSIAPANLGSSGDVVRRGGSFADPGNNVRSAFRNNYSASSTWERLGFRLASPATVE